MQISQRVTIIAGAVIAATCSVPELAMAYDCRWSGSSSGDQELKACIMSVRNDSTGAVKDWWCWDWRSPGGSPTQHSGEMTWGGDCGSGTHDGDSWLLSFQATAATGHNDDVIIRNDEMCSCTCPGTPNGWSPINFDGHGHRVELRLYQGDDRAYGGSNSEGMRVEGGAGADRVMSEASDDAFLGDVGNDAYYDISGNGIGDYVIMGDGTDCVGDAECAFGAGGCGMGESAGDNDYTNCPAQCVNEESSGGSGASCSTNCPAWTSPY